MTMKCTTKRLNLLKRIAGSKWGCSKTTLELTYNTFCRSLPTVASLWLQHLNSKLLHIPKWPLDRAVADFQIATGQDCVSKHLNMIGIAQSPLCKLYDSNEEMDAIHLAHCRALSSGSMWSRYWEARHKMCDL
ncbi:hypothetical protein TNCV_2140741 [Trichonephila clavipes]|uniref:Uncharacterized protein n=1 Tax=Trichonephila clavipes TaxID=2585209 RepID=A0A8X6VC31_TRICX|nr:hypothetical protein TNCV_2140741 [Trichonephila clavipes]